MDEKDQHDSLIINNKIVFAKIAQSYRSQSKQQLDITFLLSV